MIELYDALDFIKKEKHSSSVMMFTGVFEKVKEAYEQNKRHIWIEGGTSASKTWSILQFLIYIARTAKSPLLISIVSESYPHLRRGAMRDFFRILNESQDNNPRFNKSDHIYNFGNGKVEFFSADQPDKLRGARRDILFINEVNNISYDSFRELDSRTRLCTICDWNPVGEFFFHTNRLKDRPDSYYIHATYRDALNVVPPEVIDNILATGEDDPNWKHIYIDGLLGKVEGLVYPHFEIVKELPQGDYFYGLDFGYSNDPTVLVKEVLIGDSLYMQELIYETGLTNQKIGEKMEELGVRKHYDEIFADSAEPKSIEEISLMGFNIKGVEKGPGSVEYRRQKRRQYKQYWTEDSINCIKEQRNFRYIEDKDGKLTEKTTHVWSHGMDAVDYGLMGKLGIRNLILAPEGVDKESTWRRYG
jgi:phage terminase large subunit